MQRREVQLQHYPTLYFFLAPRILCFFPDVFLSLGGFMWLVKFPIGRAMCLAGFFGVKEAVDRGLPFCSRVGQHARRSVASSSGLPDKWWPFWMALLDRYFMIFYEDLLEDGPPKNNLETPRNVSRSSPLSPVVLCLKVCHHPTWTKIPSGNLT